MSGNITQRDDLQFPRTPGLLSGFDDVITTTDPTNLSVAGYSRREVMQAILNLKESGLPGLTQTAIEKLIAHISDFNDPHQDDLAAFVSTYITTFLRNIVPGTVPDAYPVWALSPDLDLDPTLLGCVCTRNSQLRVMTRSGLYKLIDVNVLGTDWSTGQARIPCFGSYQLINTALYPDTSTTFDVTSANVVTKDLSLIGVQLPDGTSVIHQLVATGGTTPFAFSVVEGVVSNQDYSFSFISYTPPTGTSQYVLFSVPELSSDVVPITFNSQNTYMCNTVGKLSAGYQIQLDGSIRWFCAFTSASTQNVATVTLTYPTVTGPSVVDTVPVSVDMIQLTTTARPAPIVLPGETVSPQTISFSNTTISASPEVTFCINYQSPWLTTTQDPQSNLLADANILLHTPDVDIAVGSSGFWVSDRNATQQKTIGTPQETYTLVASINTTTMSLGLTGTSKTSYATQFTSTTANAFLSFNAFNGYIIDMSIYNVFDRMNATEFLTNG